MEILFFYTFDLFFDFFDFFVIFLSALFVIYIYIADNCVESLLFLVFTYIIFFILFCCCNFEFIAFLFLLIYIGAIAILFLFVIMMLNLNEKNPLEDSVEYAVLGFCLFICSFIIALKLNEFLYLNDEDFILFEDLQDLQVIGFFFFTQYSFCVLIAGFVLLIALIGAVAITFNFLNSLQYKNYLTTRNGFLLSFFSKYVKNR